MTNDNKSRPSDEQERRSADNKSRPSDEEERRSASEHTVRDQMRRLDEISRREMELRMERDLLLQKQPWYRKPGTWIGIATVFVTIVLFVANFILSRERKELTVSYTPPSSVLAFTPTVRAKAELRFDGTLISSLAKAMIRIDNTGNRAVSEDDFKDGPIRLTIRTPDGEPMRSGGDTSALLCILDVVRASTAGQTADDLQVVSRTSPGEITYLPSLLNPQDRVELEVYLPVLCELEVTPEGKLLDGRIVDGGQVEVAAGSEIPETGLAFLFAGVNRIFKHQWLATVLFSFLAIVGVISLLLIIDEYSLPLDGLEEYVPTGFLMLSVLFCLFVAVCTMIF